MQEENMKTKLNVYLTGALVLLLFVIARPAAAQRFISFDFPGAIDTQATVHSQLRTQFQDFPFTTNLPCWRIL
jgi:hypothetical protein